MFNLAQPVRFSPCISTQNSLEDKSHREEKLNSSAMQSTLAFSLVLLGFGRSKKYLYKNIPYFFTGIGLMRRGLHSGKLVYFPKQFPRKC